MINTGFSYDFQSACCLLFPIGVPQATILGPWLFFLTANILCHPTDVCTWICVDDITLAKIVPRDHHCTIQSIVTAAELRLHANRQQLCTDKCKDMTISRKKSTCLNMLLSAQKNSNTSIVPKF